MNHDYFKNQTIVVTGAAGTVGSELVDLLLREHHPAEIRILDNNESAVFLQNERYGSSGRVTAFLGDVRDRDKLEQVFAGAHTVFHLAAHKHVYLAEYNSFDTVQTNIHGVQNVIHAAHRVCVARVLFTSSDKAVNPTSVMGTTKLLGEKLITAANIVGSHGSTVLASVRFGNVLGSRGSVVPIFAKQLCEGQAMTITDKRMTRFIMSVSEAAALVIRAVMLARGGEVFITKMPVVRITDLAQAMIELLAPCYGRNPADVKISYIGSKPGEKLYEELMSDEETHRSQELEDMFVTLPAHRFMYKHVDHVYPHLVRTGVDRAYNSSSEERMSVSQIKDFLTSSGVLEEAMRPDTTDGRRSIEPPAQCSVPASVPKAVDGVTP